jgi:8-oxo-dGTP pyrophosphatase MutT (NUDIX family)
MNSVKEIKHIDDNPNQSSMAVLIDPKDRVLILRRPDNLKPENYPGMWCIPGGKSLVGEKPLNNVIREVLEETGIELKPHSTNYLLNKQEGDKNYFFFMSRVDQEPKIMNVLDEHEEFKWIRADEIGKYNMIKDTHSIIKQALRKGL